MVKKVLLWTGAGLAGLALVGASAVAGLTLVGGVALGLGAWAADRHEAASSRSAEPQGSAAPERGAPRDPYELHLAPWERPAVAAPGAPVATRDAAGAEAFARYWVQAYAYSYVVNDPALLEATSDPGCLRCADAAATLRNTTDDGQHFVATSLRVTSADTTSTSPLDAPDTAVVHLGVEVGESVLYSTSTYHDLGGGSVEDDLVLRWDVDHWTVVSLDGGPWTPSIAP